MLWLLVAQVLASAPTSGNGIALGLFADRVDYDYQPLMVEIAATDATDVLIAVPWSVPHISSHALRSEVPRGACAAVIRPAADADLTVSIMPIITVHSRPDGVWRGVLALEDRGIFWSNYQGLIRDVAVDAERGGAVRRVVGSELNSLEQDAAWSDIIQIARSVFSGSVLYSANWDRFDPVSLGSLVDEVGVTAHFPLEGPETWSDELSRLHAFAQTQGHPLVITEYGYPALAGARHRPWDQTTGAAHDNVLQASLIDSALCAPHTNPPRSHFLWNWFGTGALTERSFTPRHQPASSVLRRHFYSSEQPSTLR
jgi:hypothetical protein